MSISEFAASVKGKLSSDAAIFTNSSSEDFQSLLGRWSNIGLKTPSAIFRPATENDVLEIVCLLVFDRLNSNFDQSCIG